MFKYFLAFLPLFSINVIGMDIIKAITALEQMRTEIAQGNLDLIKKYPGTNACYILACLINDNPVVSVVRRFTTDDQYVCEFTLKDGAKITTRS